MDNPTVNRNDNLSTGLVKRAALYIGILAFALVLLLFLGAGQASAEDVSGDITVDTTWASDSIINVTGDVNISEGVTLTIEKNVTVMFQGYYAFNVYGNLDIAGAEDNWTVFDRNSSAITTWNGVYFYEGSGGSIAYLSMENVSYPLNYDNTTDGPSMSNVMVSHGDTAIRYAFYSDVRQDIALTISGVEIWDFWAGLYVYNSNGSLDVTLDGVVVNWTSDIGYFWAHAWVEDGRIDMTITGCEFTNSFNGGMNINGDILGDVLVSDTWFSHIGNMVIGSEPLIGPPIVYDFIMEMYGGVSATSFTLDGVIVDNASAGFSYIVGSGDVILTVTDCSFTNVFSDAIVVDGDTVSSIQMTNSEFINVWGTVVTSHADEGDTVIMLDGAVMENVYYGIWAVVEFGNIDLTVVNSSLGGYYTLIDLAVNSLTLDTGFVTLDISASSFHEAELAIDVWCIELSPMVMTDTEFVNISGIGMRLEVRENDVSLGYDNVTMVNVGIGLWLYANDGDLELEFTESHINTNFAGAIVEVSAPTDADLNKVNITVLNSVFEGGDFGIWAVSVNGGRVAIHNSQFLGQNEVGFTYDSLYGQVDMDVVDSVFDGSTAEDAGNVYVVEQIDHEYILYGRPMNGDGADWDDWDNGDSWTVDLPFIFEYNGYGYSEVVFNEEGSLDFDGSAISIRPVGNVDLNYYGDHFNAYKVAEDNSSVLFNWYAQNSNSGDDESNAFQVILYATGEIQFNFAAMDGWGGSNTWDLLNDEWPYIDYNMSRVFGWSAWEADFTSYLFTPNSISPGMGIRVISQVGDVDLTLTNNTVTSYFAGGVFATTESGDMMFSAMDNDFSYLQATEWYYGPAAVVALSVLDGTMDMSVVNNTFERLWTAAVIAWVFNGEGGVNTFEVTGNQFNKVVYGVHTSVIVFSDPDEEATNVTLDVMANFQDNVMTDSYGLGNNVILLSEDLVDWTINVEQTFVNNVMEQIWYEGEYPFNHYTDTNHPPMIDVGLTVYDFVDEATALTVDHMVTVTGNHLMQAVNCYGGISVESYVYKNNGTTDYALAATITDNILENIWGYESGSDYYYGDIISVYSDVYADLGTVSSDSSAIVEGNQIFGAMPEDADSWNLWGIGVDMEIGTEGHQALDVESLVYISIIDNLVDGLKGGAWAYVDYWMDDTVGNWVMDVTVHMDSNQMFNVTYGLWYAMYDWADFGSDYWPYYDEVAVANHTLNYVVTADNNEVTSIYLGSDMEYGIIYVDVNYGAEVDPSTLFTEAYVHVAGSISISGNQITQTDGRNAMITLYQYSYSEKTGVLDVAVDMAVENNVLNNVHSMYAMVDPAWYGIYVFEYVSLDGNYDIPTDSPTLMTDVSWSITGNQVVGPFENGIGVQLVTEAESPSWNLVQNYVLDMSGNTVDFAFASGMGMTLGQELDGIGYTEMNLDVNILDNVLNMSEAYDLRRDSTAMYVGPEQEPLGGEPYGMVQIVNVLIAGNTIIGGDMGLSVGAYDYEGGVGPATLDAPFVNEMNIVVENNHISKSGTGIAVYESDAIIRNNVIMDCGTGIDLSYTSASVTGNSISNCENGIEVYYPLVVLIQDNTIVVTYNGIDVDDYYNDSTSVSILDNIITILDIRDADDGVGVYGSANILIAGNTITAQYGIYASDVYNLTIMENSVSNCEYAVMVYETDWVLIEGNLITSSQEGLYVEYCDYVVVGNNTITNNLMYGAMIVENDQVVLWNNEVSGNGDYIDEYEDELMGGLYIADNEEKVLWFIDGEAKVARNVMILKGDKQIEVLAGGSLAIQDVTEFLFRGPTEIVVDEGGLLYMSNVNILRGTSFYETGPPMANIAVHGSLWMNLVQTDSVTLHLFPTSDAEVRSSTFTNYVYTAIFVDGSSPVIADNLIFSAFGKYGIQVEGEGAAPIIVGNIIALNDHGIYAKGMDMGGIYDNLIVLNTMSGLLVEESVGRIHDNILLANKIEILLRDSDVSVEDNEIGYTNLFQVLANYAPLLSHFVGSQDSTELNTSESPEAALQSILGVSSLDMYEIVGWIKAHNGIWAENSKVQTSGNVYGLVNNALYAIRSEVHFNDDVRTITVNVPHVIEGVTYEFPLSVYVLNGIYASHSQIWVTGSTIEVLDDAIVLDACEAWVEGATLMAGDYDYFLFGGSEAFNIATTYDRAKVEDSHSLNEGTWLTLTAVEKGEPAANVTIVIKNAKGEIVFEGVTDAEGKVKVLLTQYSWTSEGKDDGFNPYTINATFESGEESMELTANQSYMDATIEGEEESDMGAILAVVGVLVIILLIVAAVVVMRRRK
jgi:parallel beta-helix repeat protein